jgi:hypothetical protein
MGFFFQIHTAYKVMTLLNSEFKISRLFTVNVYPVFVADTVWMRNV